jgi:hypothetical protein
MYGFGGIVVSVLATGPKSRGFKPCRGDRLLMAINVHFSYFPQISLLVELAESSGGRVRSYYQPASSSPWPSMLTHHSGYEQRPVGGRSSET